jgi:hypothetical protein
LLDFSDFSDFFDFYDFSDFSDFFDFSNFSLLFFLTFCFDFFIWFSVALSSSCASKSALFDLLASLVGLPLPAHSAFFS